MSPIKKQTKLPWQFTRESATCGIVARRIALTTTARGYSCPKGAPVIPDPMLARAEGRENLLNHILARFRAGISHFLAS